MIDSGAGVRIMIGNNGDGKGKREGIRRQIISKTWCSDGYDSVGDREIRSDCGSRKSETG